LDRAAPEGAAGGLSEQLGGILPLVNDRFGSAHDAREKALAACRHVIRLSSRAIRAAHRGDRETAAALVDEAHESLTAAQATLRPHPAVAYAGFLHDAEKEYVEAVCVTHLVDRSPVPGPDDLGVELPAWLNGLAEAASEMRRHMLDLLRAGRLDEAESVLRVVDDVYDLLIAIDYPDAITGGLRRTTDALRAVLERSRSDLTTTVMQARLQRAIEGRPARG
jgi:translin